MNKNTFPCAAYSGCAPAPGTLYGIGVGPGAPDLITLRAVSVLRSVDIILAAASPKNDDSLALSIAAPHLPEQAHTMRLDFPMTRDKTALSAAWAENARIVAGILRSGRDAAFLTLGDPLVYSTFGYLMRTLELLDPGLPVQIIPGVTSFQEAAARTRTVLCEGGENLLVISGVTTPERLGAALALADSAVILKAYRNTAALCDALAAAGRSGQARFVSRLGLDGEIRVRGLDNVPEKPHYLSLILAPPERRQDEPARRRGSGRPEDDAAGSVGSAALSEECRMQFVPDFAKGGGLLPAIVQSVSSGEVLMLAYMNAESYRKTLETGQAHFWSRSRNSLWHKGGTSGHVQKVHAIRLDCDSDALLLLVEQAGGAACHNGYRSCFFRELKDGAASECCPVVFDPEEVYG